jgi:hypothetical protein
VAPSTIQNVANSPTNSYPVHVTRLTTGAEIQSVNAMLPMVSNMDDDGAGTVYTAYALRGAVGSDAAWFIMKQVTVGTVTTIRFASDPFVMDQVWDNRASLTFT